jgi:cysteinyl-tRNA synthetase
MAQHAIEIMADHPLHGNALFVREDVQESSNPNARLRDSAAPKGPTPPTKWKCANEDNAVFISEEERSAIRSLIKARDDARRRRKYDVSDNIRDELKATHGVFIDWPIENVVDLG